MAKAVPVPKRCSIGERHEPHRYEFLGTPYECPGIEVETCPCCGEPIKGMRWSATRDDFVDREIGQDRADKWISVCGACYWEKRPGKRCGTRRLPLKAKGHGG